MKKNELDRLNSKIQKKSIFIESLRENISKVIVGQNDLIDKILISIISNGHILLEGVPGLAKTLTINTVANLINADFKRIQFTPDMLPSDLLGTLIYNQKTGEFNTKKGPIFSTLFLLMKSIVLLLRFKVLYWNLCKKNKLQLEITLINYQNHF